MDWKQPIEFKASKGGSFVGSNEIYEEGGQRTRDDVAEDRDYLSSASLLVVGAEQSIAGLDAEEAVRIVGHVPMVTAAAMVREMVRLDVLALLWQIAILGIPLLSNA